MTQVGFHVPDDTPSMEAQFSERRFDVPKPTEDLPITLLCKLASITVHADEVTSPDGHPFDADALRSLIGDPEVIAWVSAMTAAALAPRKRAALKATEI